MKQHKGAIEVDSCSFGGATSGLFTAGGGAVQKIHDSGLSVYGEGQLGVTGSLSCLCQGRATCEGDHDRQKNR